MSLVDLRSDTVTRPTPSMRRAMAEAEVGDDVYREDPTVNRLQARAAEIFDREAGLYVPSGTMGNQAAIKVHTHHGQEVICEERSHIYNYEMATMAAVSGCLARTVRGEDGILNWKDIAPALRPTTAERAGTGLISLENTCNIAGGAVAPVESAERVCDEVHARGLPVHLDGARIFNAATALGCTVRDLTRKFDSVMFCLSKGLGAPVGSLLVGTEEFIEKARRIRKMLGGGMRQVGVLAAAGLIALEESPARLPEDHENAQVLARGLAEMPGIRLDPTKVRTNIVIFDVQGTGIESYEIARRLKEKEILANGISPATMRMVTHCDVDRPGCLRALQGMEGILAGAGSRTAVAR